MIGKVFRSIKRVLRRIFKKPLRMILVLAALALAACIFDGRIADLVRVRFRGISDGELEAHFIDVGQGDSVLIRTKENVILVDAGTEESQYRLLLYLKSFGIKKIDCFVMTHPHADHIGGARRILENFKIGTVVMCGSDSTSVYLESALEVIDEKGIKLIEPIPGDTYGVGEISFRVLAPNEGEDTSGNDGSIVMKVMWGETSFMLTGDAESGSEAKILSVFQPEELKCDVLKAGHHGSYTSTSDAFLDAVKPEWAVISCGRDNPYSHPHSELLDRLRSHGIPDERILRTDRIGDIVFISDGKEVYLFGKREKSADDSAA